MLIAADTSPREPALAGRCRQLGFRLFGRLLCGRHLRPWSQYYRMYSYVTRELPELITAISPLERTRAEFSVIQWAGTARWCAHWRNADRYKSVSAFAPIAAPMQCPWGKKAFTNFLGADTQSLARIRRQQLVARRAFRADLIDQGAADQFLVEQLHPEKFVAAGRQVGSSAQPAHAAGLRSWLLFHSDLHGGPSAPPREATEELDGAFIVRIKGARVD